MLLKKELEHIWREWPCINPCNINRISLKASDYVIFRVDVFKGRFLPIKTRVFKAGKYVLQRVVPFKNI
jgi:hypothetical protein